jgi:hypothetical protein
MELCFDGPDTAAALLDVAGPPATSFLVPQLTIALDNPILTADIAFRREYNRNELEALEAKEMQRRDVSALHL